jgi:hypothetical protein
MTMGLKVRRVLDEDIKKKAKKRKAESDDVLESVYSKLVGSFRDRGSDPRKKKKKEGGAGDR